MTDYMHTNEQWGGGVIGGGRYWSWPLFPYWLVAPTGPAAIICLAAVATVVFAGYGITLADAFAGYAVTVSDTSFCP